MLKTIYLGMDKVDANILLELLDSHVRAGEYWGVKKHHSARTTTPVYYYTAALIDKRVDNLIVRLEEALGAKNPINISTTGNEERRENFNDWEEES